jgi:hypothetical protein
MNNNIPRRALGVVNAFQRGRALKEDMANFEPEGGPFISSADDAPLSSKASRKRKAYDKQRHHAKVQVTQKVVEVSEPAFNKTGPAVAGLDLPLGHRKRKVLKRFTETFLDEETPRSLYARRDVVNHDTLRKWYGDQGLELDGALHCTVAHSRARVMWSATEPSDQHLHVEATGQAERLGDKGALVLHLDAPELHDEWERFKNAGASWDYPSYKPHVTLTYDDAPKNLVHYRGRVILGPHTFDEVEQDVNEDTGVNIQVQDVSGIWRTATVTRNNLQQIWNRMVDLRNAYPVRRIRAVDAETGAVVDILP